MAGIADIGNGLGYIYKVNSSGAIVSVEANTKQGVQAMQQMSVTNAPLAAQRSAYGIITVLNSPGTGSITDVTINGINQIGAPIVVTSVVELDVAEQIANAINAYTAPGFTFTANIPIPGAAAVYIYSDPSQGTSVNGLTITVSATDPAFSFVTLPFQNGSNDLAVWDDVFGYQFFIDASATANPNVLGPGIVDITAVLTVRGMNSGIITINKSVNVAQKTLSGLNRACAFTQIRVDATGAPNVNLEFIDTVLFVEGDVIRLRNVDPTRVTTLIDAANAITVSTPNIYLTDSSSFALTGLNSIELQYRYSSTLGPIWVETGRSIAINPVATILTNFVTDANNAVLKSGQVYYITDLGGGAYVNVISASEYNPSATWVRRVPKNYTACWTPIMAAPVIGTYYRYNQLVYQSVTGLVGSTPSTDAVNWTPVATTNNTYYDSSYNAIVLDGTANNLLSWPVLQESDQYGNVVNQSRQHWISTGINAYSVFCWSTNGADYYGNKVTNSIFNVANSNGPVFNNEVIADTNFNNNILGSLTLIKNNIFFNSIITNNYFTELWGNNFYTGFVTLNGSASTFSPRILQNTLNGGYIINNYGSLSTCEITSNQIAAGGSIQNNNMGAGGKIVRNRLAANCFIEDCVLNGIATLFVEEITSNVLDGNSKLKVVKQIADDCSVAQCVFQSSNIKCENVSAVAVYDLSNSQFISTIIENWNTFGGSYNTFNNCSLLIGTYDFVFINSNITGLQINSGANLTVGIPIGPANIVAGEYSTLPFLIDTANPSIYSAGVVTIPVDWYSFAGSFVMGGPGATINKINGLPPYKQMRVTNNTAGGAVYTFTLTPPALLTVDDIVGAATVPAYTIVLNSYTTGAGVSDRMYIERSGTVNVITNIVNLA